MARSRSNRYEPIAQKVAAKYGIPWNLFRSLIEHESAWQPHAVSSAGAVGLTQLMPGTASGLGVDPFDPNQNLDGGARYLASLYKHTHSWYDALRGYNYGAAAAAADPNNGASYARAVLSGAGSLPTQPPRPYLGKATGGATAPAPAPVSIPPAPDFNSLFGKFGKSPFSWAKPFDLTVPKTSPGGTTELPYVQASGKTRSLLDAAGSQVGKPYVFGSGPDTSSFDCSDLIQWAYGQIGVHLPRTTFQQIKVGRPVGWGQFKPGDLIFSNGGEHVVMYVGHGKVIAAPHTGTVVQYQPVDQFRSSFAGARRII